MPAHCSTSLCTDPLDAGREEGQATVEAALLLPALMLCLALLVQPACILYTRGVMQAAAAEGCRMVSTPPTTTGVAAQSYRAYLLRRLAAVPNVPIFHEGGDEGWHIEYEGSAEGHAARVLIETTVRPLPFLGILTALLGAGNGSGGVVLRAEVATVTRPAWLEGGYGEWSSLWD